MLPTPAEMFVLAEESFGLQNFKTALEALVAGQDAVAASDGHCANQHVYRATLNTVISAEIEEPGCLDIVAADDFFIAKRIEQFPGLSKLHLIFDS